MFKISILAVVAFAAFASAGEGDVLYLPPDSKVTTIIGNGFKLDITQFDKISEEWKQVAKEAAEVEPPRSTGDESKVVVNEQLFESTAASEGAKSFGPLDQDTLRWIERRATSLTDKIERYTDELVDVDNEQRVVAQILLLNTIVDLENLSKEEIRQMKWIKTKLRRFEILRLRGIEEIAAWIRAKIADSVAIERKLKGSNNPGEKWLTNVQALKRVLHEQRFSGAISQAIIDFLGGQFSMMARTRVYEVNRSKKSLDDGLYYKKAKGRVPAHFPFSAQDAITNRA